MSKYEVRTQKGNVMTLTANSWQEAVKDGNKEVKPKGDKVIGCTEYTKRTFAAH
jgi:hypothetical protein